MFCTISDLESLLSPLGVMLFSDHDRDGLRDDDVVIDCIERATAELIGLLRPLYETDQLAQSRLVSHWCAVLASYYLCQRRGNPVPDSLAQEYSHILGPEGWIFKSKKGSFAIPGIESTSVNAPAMSNHQIDRRYVDHQSRIVQSISTPIPSALPRNFARRWY